MRFRTIVLAGIAALALLFSLVLLLNLSAHSAVAAPPLSSAPAVSVVNSTEAIGDAVAWLATQQEADGGFGTAGLTADVVLALAAANLEPRLMVTTTGKTPLDLLLAEAESYSAGGPAQAGKLALAVAAADGDPYSFAGLDLPATVWESYSATTGVFAREPYTATSTWDQSLAVLALAAAQEEVPAAAVGALVDWQEPDGSWPFTPGSPYGGDPDSTALALMALLASGRANVQTAGGAILAAEAYLRATQLESGGWGWGVASPNSTGLVIQALAALGYVPATWTWTTPAGGNPQADLVSLQLLNGAFPDWQGNPSVMATAQAVPGLAEGPLPILGRAGMAQRALTWLAEEQNSDGGFGALGSSAGATSEVVLAFAAAGIDISTVRSDVALTPLDYLITRVPFYSHDGGETGKLVLAAVAGTADPRNFGGYNLVISLTNHVSPSGQLNTNSNFKQAIGILGFSAAGETAPVTVTQWLKDQQQPDGGWQWAAGLWDSDPDTTAAAIQAVIAAGESPTATGIISAVVYLQSVQTDDGGFPASFDNQSNANTTAYAIQALLAAGEDLWAPQWTRGGRTAFDALQAFQKADGPFVYRWQADVLPPDDNLAATYQAVPALLERPLPINNLVCADGPGNQATVIIDYGNGNRESICVEFAQAPISGLDLLELAGVPHELAVEFPGMVTQIRDVGCPGDDPWCAAPMYWSYLYWDSATGWQSYAVGAADSQVVDGSVDGWHWVDWNVWPPEGPDIVPLVVEPFQPVERGADPDQLRPGGVVLPPAGRAAGADSLPVYVSFGSDLNRDAQVGLLYRPLTGTEWIPVTLARGDGAFSATLPIDNPDLYEFRGTFADPDGIRAFRWVYLPLLTR